MEGAPVYMEMSYYDHIQRRKQDKVCLYAFILHSVFVVLAAAVAASRHVNAARRTSAVASKDTLQKVLSGFGE
ncbi:hypothetical protein CDL15_Pgr007525 [Punica granatum]|uniref:Uncharacterized protein n=1 Tax=Punica granatum TaxID=22663 RepID=A0A218X954_PUNGR|nr:hypothetical protein CDL15_Pgr007525 [Punica granatum]